MNTTIATAKPRLSVKTQTIATIAAIIGAVLLPQIFHVMGAVSGIGTALGVSFLPMHLPIILVGLLAGPYAGTIAGVCGPLFSFALSGMPGIAMLPFMMVELCAYGLFAGLLRNVKLPTIAKVLIVQVAGRVVYAAALLFAFYVLGNQAANVASVWKSLPVGIFGLALQWVLLPLVVFWVENTRTEES